MLTSDRVARLVLTVCVVALVFAFRAQAAGAADPELLRLGRFGTGGPEGTVALFAHGFPKGMLKPSEAVAMRVTESKATLPAQMNPVTSWPDGSVKVALLAVETTALAQGATQECTLVKTAAAGAGAALDLAKLIQGRTATLTVAPSNGAPWTFDLLAAAKASKNYWHAGPLAVSTRIETRVPSNCLGGVTSLRLVADVIATKDGIVEIDSRLANDAVRKIGGGFPTYGYTVTLDGENVYTQAPARHMMYTAWVRRNGRAKGGPMPERPAIRPDYDALVKGGFTLPWDRSLSPKAYDTVTRTIGWGKTEASNPYPAWGLARYAGMAGGRQEIGYRTYAGMIWIKTGNPTAQFLAQRQLEVGMSRPQNYWDEERATWLTVEDWPLFTSGRQDMINCPLSVPREQARGLPDAQKSWTNPKEHVEVEGAHNGDFWSDVALLSGRRMAFDGLAMNAAWLTSGCNDRQPDKEKRTWLTGKPDYTTGVAWAPRVGALQTRGFAWGLRDVCRAAALLPDKYPRREYFNRNAEAWVNSYGANLAALALQEGELEGYVDHAGSRHTAGFMMSFVIYAILDGVNLGAGGPLAPAVLEHFTKFRVNAFSSPDFNWRNAACGNDILLGDRTNLFTRWAQSQGTPGGGVPPDWQLNGRAVSEGDWQRNVLAGLALLRDAPVPLALRVKAADAMVLYRSERPIGPNHTPQLAPESFFGSFENLNSLCPYGSTWRWDVPPVVRAGQRFKLAGAVDGMVGLIVTDGGLPRASKAEGADAFGIVEQPADNPFALSRGGALKLVGKAPAAPVTLRVCATTFDDGGKECRGPVVPVIVE